MHTASERTAPTTRKMQWLMKASFVLMMVHSDNPTDCVCTDGKWKEVATVRVIVWTGSLCTGTLLLWKSILLNSPSGNYSQHDSEKVILTLKKNLLASVQNMTKASH